MEWHKISDVKPPLGRTVLVLEDDKNSNPKVANLSENKNKDLFWALHCCSGYEYVPVEDYQLWAAINFPEESSNIII